jgi:hypothetical protein
MSINPAPRRPPQWPDHPPARGTSNRPVRMRLGQSTESVTDDRSANYSSDLCFEKPHTQWAFLSFYPQYSWTRPIPRHSALRWSRTSTPTRSGIAERDFWDVVTEALTMMWHVHPARFQPAGQGPGHRRHGRHRTGFAAGALIGGLITIFFAIETKGGVLEELSLDVYNPAKWQRHPPSQVLPLPLAVKGLFRPRRARRVRLGDLRGLLSRGSRPKAWGCRH